MARSKKNIIDFQIGDIVYYSIKTHKGGDKYQIVDKQFGVVTTMMNNRFSKDQLLYHIEWFRDKEEREDFQYVHFNHYFNQGFDFDWYDEEEIEFLKIKKIG